MNASSLESLRYSTLSIGFIPKSEIIMKNESRIIDSQLLSCTVALLAGLASLTIPGTAAGQQLLIANPHWNITLSDFGFSDFMLDNTPGFEGREYLSGEWAAAVGYQVSGSPAVMPQWLEPHFLFPDWTTESTFHVVTPLTETGLNIDGLPIAESVLANNDLEVTLRYEMIDTIVGTPMGTTPASATDPVKFISSDRYVLKQTCTIKNISGADISNLQLFQLLHGLQSQRGVYDDRPHAGPLNEFRYDVTQAGVDGTAVGAGSSPAGLEDFIGFHAAVAPSAFEIGYYGIEGNGVDDHAFGKPSDGVHLSVEDNWQSSPYASRQGTDAFAPPQRWIAGAQRWNLGNLAAGQTASLEVLLTLRTGTKVIAGTGSSGGCNGGSSVPGGVDYEFEDVSSEGSCFGEYSQADASEIAVRVAEGEFEAFTFLTPGDPSQLWEMEFTGSHSGLIRLTFGYDPMLLPEGFDLSTIQLYQFNDPGWQQLTSEVDPARHTIAVTSTTLGVFALGVDSGNTFAVNATVAPPNSGTITGARAYADGSSATLVATANAGYVFANWMENGSVISESPSYTLTVHEDHLLQANFAPVGSGRTITTSSLPSNGGSTLGDGEYSLGSSATVTATPNTGYKFSKWLENDAVVSTARSYTFTVTGDRALVAKFKPVYLVTTIADPPDAGETESDVAYEAGELAVLKAKPNDGYAFVEWTQNGVFVSDDAIYTFSVNANRDLVGHFALGNRIDVAAEPANAGTAIGGGVYPADTSVSIEAIANTGYVFVNWTENAVLVSKSQIHTFTSDAGHAFVANFIAQPALNAVLTASGAMTLWWPAGASGWVLQESPALSPESWVDSTRAVNVVGTQKQVSVSPLPENRFFRLVNP
jgi:hypothetical protein